MSNNIGIYLEGKKLDLFDDEDINITSKATDINNIGAVYTDFSQSFTVQASPNNNAIFQHFYDTDLIGTFNSNVRVPCYIEVDTIPFKVGKMQLESIKLKNKVPASYKVTFYGNLTQLDDAFANDELDVLDFSEYTHLHSLDNVIDATQNPNVYGGNVIYPLIGQSPWQFGTANIYDINSNIGSIEYKDLKPAIRLERIFEKVQEHYGVTFQGDFLETADYRNLFMWLSKEKERMKANSLTTEIDLTTAGSMASVNATVNTTTDTISFNTVSTTGDFFEESQFYQYQVKINPSAGYDNVLYQVKLYVNDVLKIDSEYVQGTKTFSTSTPINRTTTSIPYTVRAEITGSDTMSYVPTTYLRRKTGSSILGIYTTTTGSIVEPVKSLTAIVNLNEQLPKIKIKDLLGGLIKMFNLVIRPVRVGVFEIDTLDNFNAKGEVFDITNFVDIDTIDIKRPEIFSTIFFKYQKTNCILGKRFRETFDSLGEVGYGDLRATYNIDNKKELKIELPFELLMFERLQVREPSSSAGDLTDIQVGSVIEDKPPYESVATKPILFYNNGVIKHPDHKFRLGTGGYGAIIDYGYHCGNMNDRDSNQVRNTLCWGSNISTWDYVDEKNSLYNNYWKTYIESVYSLKQRKFSFSAFLPASIINNLSINDKFIINDQRYNIEDYTLNLNGGRTKLTLSNDIRSFDYSEGINYTSINVPPSGLFYTIKVKTNVDWSVLKVDVGYGTSWINFETSTSGDKSGFVTIKVDNVTFPGGTARAMNLQFTINGVITTLPIIQEGIV